MNYYYTGERGTLTCWSFLPVHPPDNRANNITTITNQLVTSAVEERSASTPSHYEGYTTDVVWALCGRAVSRNRMNRRTTYRLRVVVGIMCHPVPEYHRLCRGPDPWKLGNRTPGDHSGPSGFVLYFPT